jgi:hypothetical protein
MAQEGTTKGEKGESGEKFPAGVKASDSSGESKVRLVGGVAQGGADKLVGRDASHVGKVDAKVGEHKGGRMGEGHFYKHEKDGYPMSEGGKLAK